MTASRMEPILSLIIRHGVGEETITSTSPDETARVFLYLLEGYHQLAGQHFVARHAGTISFEEGLPTFAAFTEAFERILGVPKGSVTLTDEATLRVWFG